jgi:hypothetical protein
MIERPMNDAMWFVILIAAAMVVASCVLDFSRMKPTKKTATVTTSQAK